MAGSRARDRRRTRRERPPPPREATDGPGLAGRRLGRPDREQQPGGGDPRHDYIPDEELADTYRMADVFALSSRYEPFGMTAIEAMACGTPAVITTEGGLWEMVTWGLEALYANPLDAEAFGHALATVLLYPRISDQLARHGSQRARSSFTWNGVAQQLVNLQQLRSLADDDLVRTEPMRPRRPRTDAMRKDAEWVSAGSS